MFKWVIQAHFRYLCFNRFSIYKKKFNPLGFDPCNRSLKIRESIGTPNSQSGISFGSARVHSLTLSFIPGLPLLARNLASPCLGCKPKARVVTHNAKGGYIGDYLGVI